MLLLKRLGLQGKVLTLVRMGVLFGLCTVLGTSLILFSQSHEDKPRDGMEHRVTVVETKMDIIMEDVHDLKSLNMAIMLALLGILGETAFRVFKGKV